jgi:N-acetylglutamate synthase
MIANEVEVKLIRLLEELSLNAWPALNTLVVDGWMLRFANGYTRRANSISVLYPTTLPFEDKLRDCEAIYSARGLPTVFKMHDACQPTDLDRLLKQRGYVHDSLTSVQTLDLAGIAQVTVQNGSGSSALTEAWLNDFVRLSNVAERNIPTMQDMLNAIVPECTFAQITVNDQVVAVGIGVIERGYLSFHDIVVAESHRQRGYGTQLMHYLIAWGKAKGATQAFLQVMCNNPNAQRLYANFGFREVYRYWYREKPLRT